MSISLELDSLMANLHSTPSPYHHGDLRDALIKAAVALVAEEQDWTFSLREVARRAGVSHNAPYNHFAEKRDLLGAVAAVGFERLRKRMAAATAGIESAEAALDTLAQTYVGFAIENPALYRLMFGPALAVGHPARPASALMAGAETKTVLEGIILRGSQLDVFDIEPEDEVAREMAHLACWSALHGLAMLIIDAKAETTLTPQTLVEGVMRYLSNGLRKKMQTKGKAKP
jgi:AcrR family transcriptional regulator